MIATYKTPIGLLRLEAHRDKIQTCFFDDAEPSEQELEPPLGVLKEAIDQIRAYFSGTRDRFDLPLEPHGTPFQQDVWQAIIDIPYGNTTCYQDLGIRLQREKAVRAIGSACAKNPLSILIPCHRVIHKSGYLKGYTWGDDRKLWLLTHESQRNSP